MHAAATIPHRLTCLICEASPLLSVSSSLFFFLYINVVQGTFIELQRLRDKFEACFILQKLYIIFLKKNYAK